MRNPPYLPVLFAAAFLAAACSSGTADTAPTTTSQPIESTTTSPPTTQLEVVTTVVRIPAEELGSEGHITIGSTRYDFAFECYAAGAGDILALGVGIDPNNGEATEAIIQAFLGQAYVAVLVGEGQVLELAIDEPAELFVQHDKIRGSALRFVDAVGSAGVGEDMGLGTVTVTCESFAPGLPEDYLIS